MEKENLIKYINNPEYLDNDSINFVTRLTNQYPYFQTAHLLTVKNLYLINSEIFKSKLNHTAAYITDRKILYELIHPLNSGEDKFSDGSFRETVKTDKIYKDTLKENINYTISSQLIGMEKHTHADTELIPEVSIDVRKEYGEGIELDDIVFNLKNTEMLEIESRDGRGGDLDIEIAEDANEDLYIKDDSGLLEMDNNIEDADVYTESWNLREEQAEDNVLIDYGEQDYKVAHKEKETYGDLLPIDQSDGTDVAEAFSPGKKSEEEKTLTNVELIDRFIKGEPKIIPDNDKAINDDISADSIKDNEGFITDTLARIYVKQGYYSKAIFAYEKLILKYPEKIDYFAGQINEIKKIINNL